MNSIKRAISKAALAAAIALPMASANAAIINFFNGTNLYATMTTGGGTSFDLNFVGTGVDSGAFINELFMNGPAGTFANTSVNTVASGTYSLNGFNGGGGGGNIYDWKIDFPNANNATRLSIGEHGLWTIVVTDPNSWNLNKIHINAFDGTNSIKLNGCIAGTPGCGGGSPPTGNVPEPASLLLLGAGLLGLGAARRRKAA